MNFVFDMRPVTSPYIETIWHTHSQGGGTFISQAEYYSEIVVTRFQGKTSITVRGPETKAAPAPVPEDAEFFGIVFKLGTFMPHLLAKNLLNRRDATLPEANSNAFWLQGSAWEFPAFDNADTFVDRLVRHGLLVHDPLVDSVLNGYRPDISLRTVQRRFLQATGLTQNTVYQIKRAHEAARLLQQGVSILDTVDQLGYADQPHLTRTLKHFLGSTPAQIARDHTPV